MSIPKLVITDIDGVWTDGGMYYDQTGNEFKKFHTYDSAGVLFCQKMGIPIAIITGENTEIVRRRADKLKINYLIQGATDKLSVAKDIVDSLGISFNEVAFIGDDLNDLILIKVVGFSGATANAPEYVKKHVNFVTKKSGGDGAFREFIEFILKDNLQTLISEFID